MKPDESKNWLILYRKAVLEPDPKKSQERIAQAQRAIGIRARELWYGGVSDTAERQQMDAASHFLGVLHTIGDKHS
ncbi:MAG TPA: hypothetical protein VGS27_05015 [Candidatus Sulfotelmatobacter sp.]|nr:hypothetical protein [Candidatus Sulfotelmatobacter sp.]